MYNLEKYNSEKIVNKIKEASEKYPDLSTLFSEIRWHLEDPERSICYREALDRLDTLGFHSPSTELLVKTASSIYEDGEYFNGAAIDKAILHVLKYHELDLKELLIMGESLVEYTLASSYKAFHCITPKGCLDFSKALDNTLERILGMNGQPGDVERIMGAIIPEPPADAQEGWLEKRYPKGYIKLHDGYILPAFITEIKRENTCEEESFERYLEAHIDRKRITESARVHCIWEEEGLYTELCYKYDSSQNKAVSSHLLYSLWEDLATKEGWEEALRMGAHAAQKYGLPLYIYDCRHRQRKRGEGNE